MRWLTMLSCVVLAACGGSQGTRCETREELGLTPDSPRQVTECRPIEPHDDAVSR